MPRAYFNGKEIISGGTNFEVGDTLVNNDGVIDVSMPVNGVMFQEAFDALPPEKQNRGLYVVRGEGQPLQGVEIEEYDTNVDGCDWHVRKWSNGYVEMMGIVQLPNTSLTAWGPLYQYTYTTKHKLPVTLTKMYLFDAGNIGLNGDSSAYITMVGGRFDWEQGTTPDIAIVRPAQSTTVNKYLTYHITGSWK